MTAAVAVPVWLVILAVLAIIALAVVAALNGIAWFGAAAELAQLERKIMHISVFERGEDLRRVGTNHEAKL